MTPKVGSAASITSAVSSVIRWLGVVAALIWLLLAITGILLTHHFEINDRLVSPAQPQKNLAAIERRFDALEAIGGQAKVKWIYTTAGMRDRFLVNYVDANGDVRHLRVAGDGSVLLDTRESDHTFLEMVRQIHLSLAAGKTGEWISAISGVLLLANLVLGLLRFWPRDEAWAEVFRPHRTAEPQDRLLSWYRAIGLVGAVPAFIVVAAAVIIHFEHSIEDVVGAPPVRLSPIVPSGSGAGFAAVARAAESAVPGGRFVGTAIPAGPDATYYVSVWAPGDHFREGGYAGSTVIVNGNDASIREVRLSEDAKPAYAFIGLPYPVHTGEIAGPLGRFFVGLVGLWLVTVIALGLVLWARRRRGNLTV